MQSRCSYAELPRFPKSKGRLSLWAGFIRESCRVRPWIRLAQNFQQRTLQCFKAGSSSPSPSRTGRCPGPGTLGRAKQMSPETLPIFQKQEASPANYSESKPKIHLSAIKQNSSCANNVLPILEWTVRRNEQHSPMKYFNGFLVIPKNGYYFVYTQVTFRCPDGTCENIEYCGKKGVDVRNVMQVVSLKSPSYPAPRPIMKGESSIDNYGKWKKTIYVGGIFQLWEDDTLMVNVSNPALVGFGGEGDITYFGAFLI
uniref:tumor necrosis factor ligand superfamily member 15 isoform X2 n=1 Tax=Podarcis muralis TaxID=64176 RepID=UPI0010A07511|nr:tumor necrosis factor ligand superfamily member 15 isoform X2 [Podarcis muralis]